MTVLGDDGLARPTWAATDPLMQEYYDNEWGMPVRDERGMFERISLEAFQSGLSWATILRKRPAFRTAFDDFDPDAVAAYDESDVERLMADVGIVRNRRKIEATITNARATVALREDAGLVDLVWSFRPPSTPAPTSYDEVPTRSEESLALSKELRKERLHVRRADDDVRADGGGRHRRHPPGRQPPPRHVGGVELMLTPSQSALVAETLRVALHAAAEEVDGSMDAPAPVHRRTKSCPRSARASPASSSSRPTTPLPRWATPTTPSRCWAHLGSRCGSSWSAATCCRRRRTTSAMSASASWFTTSAAPTWGRR